MSVRHRTGYNLWSFRGGWAHVKSPQDAFAESQQGQAFVKLKVVSYSKDFGSEIRILFKKGGRR